MISRWSPNLVVVLVAGLLTACASLDQPGRLRVRTDFPGGSATVEELGQTTRTIRISPTKHEGRGWVAWWHFKLEGMRAGETITIEVGPAPWATPDRAVFSVDGKTWQQTPPGVRAKDRITYRIVAPASSAWFAWGPRFVLADAQRLVDATARAVPFAKAFVLTKSAEGRAVPALRIAEPGTPEGERLGIWIHARQHAWESGSSWVASGLINWLVSDDPRAQTLRRKANIVVVPIMDVDNVERGAGGKNQTPHDHNRDWSDGPHWPEVAAAMERISELNSAGHFDLFLDLHNPAANDRAPFFFIPASQLLPDRAQQNLASFLAAARAEITGPLKLAEKPRETGPSYDKNWQRISGNWIARNCRDHVVSACLETAWNTPESTAQNYERVGRELGLAVERYFREDRR